MLLFLDQETDLHADWVEAECHSRHIPYFRLCTEKFPKSIQLAIKLHNGIVSGAIYDAHQEIPLEDIVGVWYRRPGAITPHPNMDKTYTRFALMEAQATLNGLYRVLWDRRWVSPPQNLSAANYKIYQLRFAHQVGFKTAPTIVTNNPDEAVEFFNACNEQVIYKTLRQVAIAYEDDTAYGIYTSRVTRNDFEQQLDSIALIPCLFQQFIPKKYELRINIIGKYVWATAIYTQESEHTKLDFRPYTAECKHQPIKLPPQLETMCLEMNKRLGLKMSNIDMIVTPEDEYIFLEINPNGQWAWIEDIVGFPLCTAIVDELLGVDTLAHHPYIKENALVFEPNTAIKQ